LTWVPLAWNTDDLEARGDYLHKAFHLPQDIPDDFLFLREKHSIHEIQLRVQDGKHHDRRAGLFKYLDHYRGQ
jgi:hypothetical protein